jgi:hypothetical protein
VPRRHQEEVPATESAHAVAAIRTEVGRLRSSLVRIEQGLSALEAAEQPASASARARPERYLRVLVDVYERGGRHGVDPDGLAAIGAEYGYDRRGLGGFFTGTRAPLRRVDERVVVTPHGQRLVDVYLAEITT